MKKLVPFLVIGVLLLVVGLIAAQNSNLPGSGWNSGQQVQNVGTLETGVSMTAYDKTGAATLCGPERMVPKGGSTTWQTASDCPVTAPFVGSAVVGAGQPLAAIVNVNNVGTGLANGQYQGTDGADVDTTIVFPLVKHNHGSRTTTFYVQNAGTTTAKIDAKIVMRSGAIHTKSYNSVPGNAMVVITPKDVIGGNGGQGQVGSLTVTSLQPLAGAALEHQTSAAVAQNLMASKGFSPNDFDNTAYCPLYRNAFAAQKSTTGVQVQNVDVVKREITMEFIPRGGGTPLIYMQEAEPGASVTFYAANLAGFPTGAIGSVELSSLGEIVAVVNEDGGNKSKFSTYACMADNSATTTINIPLAKELFLGNTTGIQIQNVGTDDAVNIQVVYKDSKGPGTVTVKNADPIEPGASFTVNQVSNNPSTITVVSGSLASIKGKNNSVVITADQPVVAIANEVSTPAEGKNQDNKNYEGFNQ